MGTAFSGLLGQTPQAAMLKPLVAPAISTRTSPTVLKKLAGDAAPLKPLTAPALGARTSPAELKRLAGDFESSFISSLLQPMFNTLSTDGPFGGGQGEAAFKSFLTEAMGKQISKAGGLGLSGALQKEFLRMQGAKS
jgi:Rod binding domain-containing protein